MTRFNARTRFAWLASISTLLFSSALVFGGCSDDDNDNDDNGNGSENGDLTSDCDPIDPSECALPWPSNLYLVDDASTATGARLQFGETSLPKGKQQISPEPWNDLDGYGVSTPIMFKAPNLDLANLPSETEPRGSWDGELGDAAIFKVHADDSLTRIPFWAEQDLREDPEKAVYYLRPAVILEEGARYIVMLRNLKNTDGETLARSDAFDTLVRGDGGGDPRLKDRQERFDWVFARLQDQGVDKEDLYLAWDFNVASHDALHGPMLQGRALILDKLDGGGPDMTIVRIEEFQRDDPNVNNDDPDADNYNPDALSYNPYIRYAIQGKFTSPQIVEPYGAGHRFKRDDNGDIALAEDVDRDYWVRIPYSAVGEDSVTANLMQYGHGLMNLGREIRLESQERMAEIHNYVYFASNWTGMSTNETGGVFAALNDFSNFRFVADTMHQGILEFMVLAKAMKHTFFELDEIEALAIDVDTDEIVYSGNSQGGIYGPSYLAIAPDVTLGQMGVPGLNYNILLQRSSAFDRYASIAALSYGSDPTTFAIALAAAQSLWDMTDAASWFTHLSKDPIDGAGNEKYVLMHPARGDYQVSTLTNVIAANSDVDLHVMEGWGRDISKWGLEQTPYLDDENKPFKGSGVVMYSTGNDWPVPGNLPPEDNDDDPHGTTRYFHELQIQTDHFLRNDGEIKDVCNGQGCNFTPMTNAECDALRAAEPGPGTRSTQCWKLVEE